MGILPRARVLRPFALSTVVIASCSGPRAPPPVLAYPSSAAPAASGPTDAAGPQQPAACARPWKLEAVGGDSRIVVVCGNDVQRQPLEESSEMAQALFPALDPAQERVCSCTGRVRTPPFIDLVFTSKPDEGRVTARATPDDDLDPDVGSAFIACIGVVTATFAPMRLGACAAGNASLIYPVRLELEP